MNELKFKVMVFFDVLLAIPVGLALWFDGGFWERVALCLWWPTAVLCCFAFVPMILKKRFEGWPLTIWPLGYDLVMLLAWVKLGHMVLPAILATYSYFNCAVGMLRPKKAGAGATE